MRATSHPGICCGRVAARSSESFRPYGILSDLVEMAGSLHLADVAQEFTQLIGSGEGLTLQDRVQRTPFFLRRERTLGQDLHSCRKFYHRPLGSRYPRQMNDLIKLPNVL